MPTKMSTGSKSPKRTEIATQHAVHAVAFTIDGKHLIGGEYGGEIRQWGIEHGLQVGPTMKASGHVYGAVVSPDGKWIVTGDWGQKVIVWNTRTYQKVLEISDHSGDVNSVDISSDSTRIASGSDDKTARVFDIRNGNPLVGSLRHYGRVYAVKFSPAGDRIATATYNVASVRVYNAYTGAILFDIPVEVKTCPVTPLGWSLDGQQLFATSSGKITCLNTSTSSQLEWSVHNDDRDSKPSIITNGKFIVCTAGSFLSLWDAFSQKQIGPVLEHTETVGCIALSPNERHLACGHGNKFTIHDLTEIIPLAYFQGYPPSQPPLMHVSELVLNSWSQHELTNTETILSKEIEQSTTPTDHVHALANRALVRTRLCQWNSALDDANKSLQIGPSPIAYITIALCGLGQGDPETALQEFDIAFHDCEPHDSRYLLLLKAVLSFISGKPEDAIARMHRLLAVADEDIKYYHHHVLATMYFKRGEYERTIQILERSRHLAQSTRENPLVTINLIFGWTFDELELTAYQRLCEDLYASGRVKDLADTLSRMVNPLNDDEKEVAHGRILKAIVTRLGEVSMLAWTGRSSSQNTCLPASPSYLQKLYALPSLEGAELERRTSELQTLFPPLVAGIIFGRVTRLQPVRFTHFRLHLPCIVFPLKTLRKEQENVYNAKVFGLGDVEFTTTDCLPLEDPWKLVFVHPWIRDLEGPTHGQSYDDEMHSDTDFSGDSVSKTDSDTELVRVSIVEEVPHAPLDDYTKALQLIARLGQPFSALLLLRQPDGSYKRVVADHEIVVPGLGSSVPKDIRAEVLEIS